MQLRLHLQSSYSPEDVSFAVLAPDECRVHLGQVRGEAEVADVPGRVLHEVVAVVDPILGLEENQNFLNVFRSNHT